MSIQSRATQQCPCELPAPQSDDADHSESDGFDDPRLSLLSSECIVVRDVVTERDELVEGLPSIRSEYAEQQSVYPFASEEERRDDRRRHLTMIAQCELADGHKRRVPRFAEAIERIWRQRGGRRNVLEQYSDRLEACIQSLCVSSAGC